MTGTTPLSLDQSQRHVEAMMEQGMAFSDVEDAINASRLLAVHKAALWLLAWSLRDVDHQRQDARLTLAAVGASDSASLVDERGLPIGEPPLLVTQRLRRQRT